MDTENNMKKQLIELESRITRLEERHEQTSADEYRINIDKARADAQKYGRLVPVDQHEFDGILKELEAAYLEIDKLRAENKRLIAEGSSSS